MRNWEITLTFKLANSFSNPTIKPIYSLTKVIIFRTTCTGRIKRIEYEINTNLYILGCKLTVILIQEWNWTNKKGIWVTQIETQT
jgi:hypothetical protein